MKFQDMPYERIDFEWVKTQILELMEELKTASDGEAQFETHKKFYKLSEKVETQVTLSSVRHTIDTTDEFYEKEQNYYDEQIPEYSNLCVAYQQVLFESPYRDVLEEKIGAVAFENMELAMKSVSQEIIPLMQEENALVTEYEKLLASAKIDWDGETLNLSLLTPYLKNKDAKIRRKASEKQNEFFTGIENKLDELYDKLVKNRTLQAKKLGFDTYTPLGYLRMQRNSYGREQIEFLRKQVKEVWVPFAESLYEQRKKRLGLERLTYSDELVYGPEGNPMTKWYT